MILSEIKKYLKAHKRASLADLVNHFDAEPEAMQGMLGQFVRKGRVLRLDVPAGGCSGGCGNCKCEGSSMEIYEWQ